MGCVCPAEVRWFIVGEKQGLRTTILHEAGSCGRPLRLGQETPTSWEAGPDTGLEKSLSCALVAGQEFYPCGPGIPTEKVNLCHQKHEIARVGEGVERQEHLCAVVGVAAGAAAVKNRMGCP